MRVNDFYYKLPEELIAQRPSDRREESRLLILDRSTNDIEHKIFKDILDYLNPGDCLVLNNTKVIPARLLGEKEGTGGKIEFLLLRRYNGDVWEVILKPGRKAKVGTRFSFGNGELKAEIIDIIEDGNRLVKFEYEGIFEKILDQVGMIPLPPYITEKLRDTERYQTVYGKCRGSAAAPTAGLHFSEELLKMISEKGIDIAYVTLHIGLGTFRPVKVKNVLEHKMHSEMFYITKEQCEKINNAKKRNKRIIAVGTTSCRVLESVASKNGLLEPRQGETDIFIYPGYKFKIVDAILTNFHLPESTLIMLISAFYGREKTLNAYNVAVNEEYRFFSFGDAMFIK